MRQKMSHGHKIRGAQVIQKRREADTDTDYSADYNS